MYYILQCIFAGAMAGCILGLLAENIGESATSWILPFTGGGFIYIATVSVMPELFQSSTNFQRNCRYARWNRYDGFNIHFGMMINS